MDDVVSVQFHFVVMTNLPYSALRSREDEKNTNSAFRWWSFGGVPHPAAVVFAPHHLNISHLVNVRDHHTVAS